jgi:hypothetical protein
MDTNNSNASVSTDDEEMEIPTQEATDALFEGFDKRHVQWEKIKQDEKNRRKNKAKEVMRKRIVRRNRKKHILTMILMMI